ncbi:MAG: nucleoside 2-deoxyribosyltransferase [Nanoarchaeota archaeon]|nr:nucleoside 2-deoxyribosyltransferase [Nanoarchaeota archaeon]
MTNIYFAASIRADRDDAQLYQQIVDHLKNYGTVLSEHVGNKNLPLSEESGLTDREIHNRDIRRLLSSDVLVAEVTQQSLRVGYEIRSAVVDGIKVLCLHRPQEGKRLSAMVFGSRQLRVENYETIEQAREVITNFFEGR